MAKISKKHIYLAVGGIAVLLAFSILRPLVRPIAELARPADWRASNSGNRIHLTGRPATSNGPAQPNILATCSPGGLSMSIYFGVPMANSHRGTGTSLITVDLRLDNGGVVPLVFSPSQDWT